MLLRVVLAGACLAGVLSGCALVDGTVAPRYDTISRSLAQARNESILLNIVRAGHDYPLSFSTVSQAIPQMTNSTSLGLPNFLLGPNPNCISATGTALCLAVPPTPVRDIIFNNNTLANSTNVQTQFTLSTQETHDFYNALLRPVDLYILQYFIRQGYSRELLFWLFADSVEITTGGRTFGYQYNPPYDPGCAPNDPFKRCFREWAEIATITGLAVEEHTYRDDGESKSAGKPSGQQGGGRESGGREDAGSKPAGTSKSGGTGKSVTVSRFCFNDVLAQQGRRAMMFTNAGRLGQLETQFDRATLRPSALSPKCGVTPWPTQPDPTMLASDTLKFTVGRFNFRIVPRSAYGIYQFLGKLLKQSMSGAEFEPTQLPPGLPAEDWVPGLSTVNDDNKLLNIAVNIGGPCFVETHFIDGRYCVPENGSANTKRIFGLLAQLIALQTTAADLAITPVVRAIQ